MKNYIECQSITGLPVSIRKEDINGVCIMQTPDVFFRVTIYSPTLSHSEEFESQASALERYNQIMDELNT